MTEVERGAHVLALRLGMTVSRLKQEMTMREYFAWVAFFRDNDPDAPIEIGEDTSPEQIGALFGVSSPPAMTRTPRKASGNV